MSRKLLESSLLVPVETSQSIGFDKLTPKQVKHAPNAKTKNDSFDRLKIFENGAVSYLKKPSNVKNWDTEANIVPEKHFKSIHFN